MSHLEALITPREGLTSAPSPVQEIINSALFGPIGELFGRPAKNVRAALVRAGYLYVKPSGGITICRALSDALESIHAGSLIIDDIQDGSRERRGSPCVHEKYGIPLALNAGNYLYFQPFSWLESLGLPERVELRLYRLFHEAMLNAHVGQALDLGADVLTVAPHKLEDICYQTSRMKTGALTSLALTCGAIVAGASDTQLKKLRAFGERFGVALQRFDDIGNLSSNDNKRYEDLLLKRPSWAWALAAKQGRFFELFKAATLALPDEDLIELWLERQNFKDFAQKENERFLDETLATFAADKDCFEIVEALGNKLRTSYGK